MSSSDPKRRLIDIAELLLNQTTAGAIQWRTTDEDRTFLYSFSRGSITIRRFFDQTSEATGYALSVLNNHGTEVEELQQEWEQIPGPKGGTQIVEADHNDTLRQLWATARRSALDIDELLDDLEREIKHPKDWSHKDFKDEPPF
jgi:hypothetical protein